MVERLDLLRAQLMRRNVNGAALVLSAAFVFLAACADRPGDAAAATPPSQGQGGSPYSIDSALALFRAGLEPAVELESAQPSIDSTIRRFARMLEQRDTAAMRAMVMTRREFAYLYYPTSPFTRTPTLQEPGLAWFLHINNSQKGATRLLERFGGKPLRIAGNACRGSRIEGDNRLWNDCVQRIVVEGDTTVIRLFGGVYERNGRFKILSYANDL
jgi:hypothetical protein